MALVLKSRMSTNASNYVQLLHTDHIQHDHKSRLVLDLNLHYRWTLRSNCI